MSSSNPFASILREFKANALLTAVLELILGLFLILNPHASQLALCTLIGIAILAFGVFSILSYVAARSTAMDVLTLCAGILAAGAGVLFLFNPAMLADFIATVLGLFVIVCAAGEIRRALTMHRFGYRYWYLSMIAGAAILLFGFSLIFAGSFYGDLLMMYIGIVLVISAVADLLSIWRLSRLTRDISSVTIIRY